MAAQSDVEELIVERTKLGGNRYRMSKRAKGDFTYLLSLFDRLVPYTAPAVVPSETVEKLERRLNAVEKEPFGMADEENESYNEWVSLARKAVAALKGAKPK